MQEGQRVPVGGAEVEFTFTEMKPVESVGEFLASIAQEFGRGDYRVYFRGEGLPTDILAPSIGRKHYYLGRSLTFDQQAERRLIVQFRRHAYEHYHRLPTEWETMFLARHHGLPTRLLDWTSNPLVALYFAAFYENQDLIAPEPANFTTRPGDMLSVDGTVWAVQRRSGVEEIDVFCDDQSPLEIPGIKLIYPFNPTPRMTAQSGVFTLHADPWTNVVECAGRPYAASELDIARLVKWRIPSSCKTEIVLELERMSVNNRTLFPDLEGLAKGLWQSEIIQQCFRDDPSARDAS